MTDIIDDFEQVSISIGAGAHGLISFFTATPVGPVAPGTQIRLDYQYSNDGDFAGTIWSELWNVTDSTLLFTNSQNLAPGGNSGNQRFYHTIQHDTHYQVIVGHDGASDDTADINVLTIGEGLGDITNLLYDVIVLPLTPIDIQFDITNNSNYQDTLWWGLYTKPAGSQQYTQLVSGTYSYETFTAHQTKTKIITIAGGISEPLDAQLKAGHVE